VETSSLFYNGQSNYWVIDSRGVIKYGNEIARVLRGIGDLLLTAPTDESDIHST
jgi:hypothetical protein